MNARRLYEKRFDSSFEDWRKATKAIPRCCLHGEPTYKKCPECGTKLVNCEVAFSFFKDSMLEPIAFQNGHCYGCNSKKRVES